MAFLKILEWPQHCHLNYFIKFFIVFLVINAQALAAQKPYENSAFADVDGISIHYRYWGGEEKEFVGSVLLIHGFGASTFSWQGVADSLNSLGYEVVAIDLPPFGFSDRSHRLNQSITARAVKLKIFLEQELPERRWHIAGHSMGGAVAQAYAILYPEDLKSATFVSAALFPELHKYEQPVRLLLRLSPVRFILGELAQEWFMSPRRVAGLLESAYGMEPTEKQIQAYLAPLQLYGTSREILSAASYSRELFDLDASDMKVPAIAIWGDADTWVAYRSRKNTLAMMPHVKLVLLENVGHNPMETHLNEFLDVWTPFLLF